MANVITKVTNVYSIIAREFGKYAGSISLVAILSFISSLLEGIGINSVIPLFAFVNRSSNKGTDLISQFIEKVFGFFHITYTLKYLLVFIGVLFLLKAAILFLATWLAARLYTEYERTTRQELLVQTLRARWPFLVQLKNGHLEQTLTTDVSNSSNLLSYLTAGLLILGNLLVYLLISFNISPPIALLTVILGLMVFLFFKPFFQKNRLASNRIEKLYKEMTHFVNQHVLGMKTVKSLAVENQVAARGRMYFEEIRNANLRIVAVRNLTNTLLQPIGLIFILGIFSWFYKLTDFNFASFAVVVYSINKIFSYVQQAQVQLHSISSQVPFIQSLQRYREVTAKEQERAAGNTKFKFTNSLSLEQVNFSYTDTQNLKNLNFKVKHLEMVGIIGPSGAGKTTLVDLLLGLYEPSTGKILVDGVPLDQLSLDEWRSRVGYVSQDMFLLNDTIANNIRFYNGDLTLPEIQSAAALANIDKFVQGLPKGYDTLVGERGVRLSGGERQRVILARVLARKPNILILDEATSALDNESEASIQAAIEGLRSKLTVIIIAHRLSTVMSADRLLVIEGGVITEEGAPAAMLKNHESYLSKVTNIHAS